MPKPKFSVKNAKYWRERSVMRLEEAEKNSIPYLRQIQSHYRAASKQVTEAVRDMYATYYRDNGFDLAALHQIAPSGDIKRFRADLVANGLVQDLPDNYKGRMNRLELIQAQIWSEMKKATQAETELSGKLYSDTVKNSYYRTIFDTSKGLSPDLSFSKLNDRAVDKILEEKFYGKKYDDYIWGNSNNSISKIQDILAESAMSGRSYSKTIMDLHAAFGVEEWQAERLLRTETNYFENKAELEAMKELGFKRYQILAVLDNRTSEICQGQDHRVCWLKDAQQGENAPPFHPNCRTTIVAYFGKEFEPKMRVATSGNGKVSYIENISYEEWQKKHNINQRISRISRTGYQPTIGKNNLDVINVKQGAPMSQYDAMVGANPNYEQGRPYQINCQRCVPTYEMRRRGYDVVANPNTTEELNFSGKEFFIDPKTKRHPKVSPWEKSPQKFLRRLESQPDGRYGILNQWKNSDFGHTWVAEVKDSKVTFIDPQMGKVRDIDATLSKSQVMAFYRMDSMQITGNSGIIKLFMKGKE